MNNLLNKAILPDWFEYPNQILILREQNLINLDPWEIIFDDRLENYYNLFKNKFKNKSFVPFALKMDSDEVACWSLEHGGKVVIIDERDSFGGVPDKIYNDFWDWFRAAIEDMIDFNT